MSNTPPPADQHCYVCGSWLPHDPTPLHTFITVADFMREVREEQRQVTVTFPNGTHSVEANYVAEYRPY